MDRIFFTCIASAIVCIQTKEWILLGKNILNFFSIAINKTTKLRNWSILKNLHLKDNGIFCQKCNA